MDTLRGDFATSDGADSAYGSVGPDSGYETRSAVVPGDERRMQVRAYNFWASLLGERQFPDVSSLRPEQHPDFGPYSVLLDFSAGIDNPKIGWLGGLLAEECGVEQSIRSLAEVPSRSLLSRITDHYMQILANQAPIGFEAEFVNLRGVTILYRGILLPFSHDDAQIDCIYGVINWKEMADQASTDALLRQVDETLGLRMPLRAPPPRGAWADGPANGRGAERSLAESAGLPAVAFGEAETAFDTDATIDAGIMPLDAYMVTEDQDARFDESDIFELTADMELADWLASARELAQAAVGCEDRSRQALYAAIGRAYDFVLAAAEAPEELAELLEDAGLKVQERAPLVPLMKLVFGADYDKTRLTEFASVIAHGQRLGLERGALTSFLTAQPGGIKAVVRDERRQRREETERGEQGETRRERMAKGLRALSPKALSEVGKDSEFSILVARRDEAGQVILLGEVTDDEVLLDRAARHLLG
ncbi:hypothetical protein [Sphingomonas sp. IC081]|uniref:PAS domain-containing protein n=1 Tax=Sphingomonas sp. IC081 TaxID=304378 RepID=UPI001159A3BA|nr:hypothetical protein [Sphingomonas sp. IC081]QDK34380.1 hypothetical protein DM450_16655 [Sphingomonas sp. IC081]